MLMFDDLVELDERTAEPSGQHRAECRLAGAAQADKGDTLVSRRWHRNAHLRERVQEALYLLDGQLTQVYQRTAARLLKSDRWQQVEHVKCQRACDCIEGENAGIAEAELDLRDKALRHVGLLRQYL